MLHTESSTVTATADIVDLRGSSISTTDTTTTNYSSLSTDFEHDVAVVGMGYVGLPTSLSFTNAGLSVMGVEINPQRVGAIRSSDVDLVPRDQLRLTQGLRSNKLELTTVPESISRAAAVLVCVPTPVDRHDVPDLTALRAACRSVVAHAVPGQVIMLTSTTYVGTTRDLLVKPLIERGFTVGSDIFVAFSPERINPGTEEFPQEIVPRVLGGVTQECSRRAMNVVNSYATSVHIVSSPEAAEMTKLLENTFRAVNIALINELADVSDDLGIEIEEVIQAAATKPYGYMAFHPGPGVGGHCIPCDPHYLLWQLRAQRRSLPVVEHAMTAIALRPGRVVQRARDLLAESGRPTRDAKVLVVGVAYKPAVADMRESPALQVLDGLRRLGIDAAFYDPLVTSLRLHDGTLLEGVSEPAKGTYDLVLLHTLHPNVDYDWAADHQLLLDTTFTFEKAPHRHLL